MKLVCPALGHWALRIASFLASPSSREPSKTSQPDRRVFACFHKRYSPFNAMAREDLAAEPGEAISMHAIVYEVPLPARHWYRWPSSRTCIVSNGCHWLDQFLYLNDFAAVREASLVAGDGGAVSCAVSLENGAFLTLALTHEGSARLGVRDHVELRANGACVVIENGARYLAEGPDRVLRRGAPVGKRSVRQAIRRWPGVGFEAEEGWVRGIRDALDPSHEG